MNLTHYKTDRYNYYKDFQGRRQRLFFDKITGIAYFKNDNFDGEILFNMKIIKDKYGNDPFVNDIISVYKELNFYKKI